MIPKRHKGNLCDALLFYLDFPGKQIIIMAEEILCAKYYRRY